MSRKAKKDIVQSTLESIQKPTEAGAVAPRKALLANLYSRRDSFNKFFYKEQKKIQKALAKHPTTPIAGTFWRAVNDDFGDKPLSSVGGTKSVTRFNRFQPCIYLAATSDTATREVRLEILRKTTTLISIHYQLSNFVDLTTKTKCAKYGIDIDLMMGPWDVFNSIKKSGRGMSYYSQYVARAVRNNSIEGILYSSKRHKGKKCLIIFTDLLQKTSSLTVIKPSVRVKDKDKTLTGKK